MKVRFNLKDAGGLILLKFRYIKGRLPLVYSTRQHIEPELWDKTAMRAIVKNAATEPHLSDLNSLLQKMEHETLSIYRQHIGGGQLIDSIFKEHLNAVFFGQTAETFTVISFIEKEMMAQRRAAETLGNYRQTAATLAAFQKARRAKMDFESINFEWLANFKDWCFGKGYSTGSVGKFVSITKAAVNLARKRQLTTNRHVTERGFSVTVKKGNRKKLALYPHEVDAIARFDFMAVDGMARQSAEAHQRCADIIVAGCDTGLRHSDFDKVDRRSVRIFKNIELLDIWTKKSDKPVAIPLTPRMRGLLEKYDYQMPTLSRSRLLVLGRKVLEMVGIDREVAVRETKGGRAKVVHYPLYAKFAAHVTRRTFARTAYQDDPTLLTAIQAILGHSSEEQTKDYIDVEGMLSAEHFAKRMELKQSAQVRAINS